ncbi:uncharacterized protein G2W53_006122 [Senna tora]|uniref:Uncharacterized protein n=1 Tax=Senna tora TaxID=362788 RepID=A0A834X4K1_9FABA|nr:uncharacterized protein G2W53_006122 [Senna tora]
MPTRGGETPEITSSLDTCDVSDGSTCQNHSSQADLHVTNLTTWR